MTMFLVSILYRGKRDRDRVNMTVVQMTVFLMTIRWSVCRGAVGRIGMCCVGRAGVCCMDRPYAYNTQRATSSKSFTRAAAAAAALLLDYNTIIVVIVVVIIDVIIIVIIIMNRSPSEMRDYSPI